MDPSVVTGLAAVLGSLVGGFSTLATAWVTQRT
jgi:FlaG/FlaF family flagellin (archaellin)